MGNDFSRVLEENCLKVEDLNINIHKLGFKFSSKPLLIGGKAMEYYQIRQAGGDIDFVVTKEDYEQLAYKYPSCIREIYDDFGVCKYEFEVWKKMLLKRKSFL